MGVNRRREERGGKVTGRKGGSGSRMRRKEGRSSALGWFVRQVIGGADRAGSVSRLCAPSPVSVLLYYTGFNRGRAGTERTGEEVTMQEGERARDGERVRKQQSPGDERRSTKQWIQNNARRCAEIEQRLKTCQDKDKPPLLNCHFPAILSENKWQS